MVKFIKKLYKKWDDWENEEVTINLGYDYITTNNYTTTFYSNFSTYVSNF